MSSIETYDANSVEYDTWFEKHRNFYESELVALKRNIPENKIGVEIGVGTGRFAGALKIQFGVEPSLKMAKIAKERGVKTIQGIAENLPLKDNSFDYAVMVTTDCFLDDIAKAFSEVRRILKPEGTFIIGMIDRTSSLGKRYEIKKSENKFYKSANFHTPEEITEILSNSGFGEFSYTQTLIDMEGNKIEEPITGYGLGGFVVIKAILESP